MKSMADSNSAFPKQPLKSYSVLVCHTSFLLRVYLPTCVQEGVCSAGSTPHVSSRALDMKSSDVILGLVNS